MSENEKQEPDMFATPAGISIQKIEDMVKELFDQKPDNTLITIYTGHGGCKEYLKSLAEQFRPGEPYTWRLMRRMYYMAVGFGWLHKAGGYYKLS